MITKYVVSGYFPIFLNNYDMKLKRHNSSRKLGVFIVVDDGHPGVSFNNACACIMVYAYAKDEFQSSTTSALQ